MTVSGVSFQRPIMKEDSLVFVLALNLYTNLKQ